MDSKKRLAYAIIRFLHDQLRHGGLSSDAQESLEGSRPSLRGWGEGSSWTWGTEGLGPESLRAQAEGCWAGP